MTCPPVRRALPLAVCLAAAWGCGPDPIRSYDAPKTPEPKADAPGEYRILGAMFPADDPRWFFKLAGKADALAPHEAEFDKFVSSIRFPNGPDKPPAYDLPAGWTSAGPRGTMTADVLRFGPPDKPLELTVTSAGGGLAGNVKRWAGQVGATGDQAAHTKEVTTTSGAKGVRVDLSGPQNPAAGGPMMMGGK